MRAFSLVELSIVLVILGLLTGGILAGQSLIRAAELRTITQDFSRFATSLRAFQDKYMALPGDMRNATSFWGNAATGTTGGECTNNATNTGTGTQTCNGNGAGLIGESTVASYERLRAWQHLANAGLIEGSYTGVGGPGGTTHVIRGENAPASRLSNGAWHVSTYTSNGTPVTASTTLFDGLYNNVLGVGMQASSGESSTPIMTPEEAWNIDTKIDDGQPAIGNVVARPRESCTNMTAALADSTKYDATYNLTVRSLECAPIFRKAL